MTSTHEDHHFTLLHSILVKVNVQTLHHTGRYYAFSFFDTVITHHAASLQEISLEFVSGFVQAFDGEKDPRNLMLAFSSIRGIIREFDIAPHIEDLFEVTFCYFPITFSPPPDDANGISSEQLKAGLQQSLAATPYFAKFALPLLLEKLASSSDSTKIFHASSHDLEQLALITLQAVTTELSLGVSLGGAQDAVEHFLGPVSADCLKQLQADDARLVQQSCKALKACALSSGDANFVTPLIDFKEQLYEVFTTALTTQKEHQSLRLRAVKGLYGMTVLRQLLPEKESACAVEHLVRSMLHDPNVEVQETAVTCLACLSNHIPQMIHSIALPPLLETLPTSEIDMSMDEAAHRRSLDFHLYAISKTCLQPSMFVSVVPQVLMRIDMCCHGHSPDTPYYPLALLSTLLEMLRHKAALGHQDIPQYLDQLIPHLLGMCIYPTLAFHETTHVMMDPAILETIANLARLVMTHADVYAQNVFVRAIFNIFVLGNLSVLATFRTDLEQVSFAPLHSDSRASQQNTSVLFAAVIDGCRQQTSLPVDNVQEFTESLATVALKTSNQTQRGVLIRIVATILNKYNRGDVLHDLISTSIVPKLHSIIFTPNLPDSMEIDASKEHPGIDAALEMYIWITKSLVLSVNTMGHDMAMELTKLFVNPALGRVAANGFAIIIGEQKCALTKELFAVIRILPIVVRSLSTTDQDTKFNTLLTLQRVIQDAPDQISEQLSTLLPILFSQAEHNVDQEQDAGNGKEVRVAALECVATMARSLPPPMLEPYKEHVLQECGRLLDDPKRAVRLAAPSTMPYDPTSLSNLDEVKTNHIHLDLAVDFAAKTLTGSAELDVEAIADNVTRVILDTSYIAVHSVTHEGSTLQHTLEKRHEKYGSALVIELGKTLAKGDKIKIAVGYATTEECTACQWLEPSQTVGKKHPYLFTQCQAIHARSMVPCQDSPSVKLTYSANINAPLRAVMSAVPTGEEKQANGTTTYKFQQKTRMPSYLIALAVGNLEGREIGPRSTVWTEPEVIEAAAWEFVDTETFIRTGEELLTPYDWGRYDLLVLPASFPYGGMENPCLTFVTPSLLAGDRSLVDVVAHEIAHSWMGNLVTTENWEHFWLNEGFTVFVERKILGRMQGKEHAEFSAIIGHKALVESVELYGEDHPFTALRPCLRGEDPDDAFSSVPYEKGFNLLYYLEKHLGGADVFEPYLKAHVQQFAGRSINTDDWKAFLYSFMEKNFGQEKVDLLNKVDWEAWLAGTGMPPVANKFDDTLAKACNCLCKKWDQSRHEPKPTEFSSKDIENFSSTQTMVFLERVSEIDALPHTHLDLMDELYQLSKVQNSEIKFRWQMICLKANYESVYPSVAEFASTMGRMKFCRPLLRSLYLARHGAELARATFREHRSFYHPIAAAMIAKDLGLAK
ncbi:Leukotriene A-4 hydrolase [Mortierella alpina]|nr:Leukotriene A-4 hydrolase [Mortierella alpina]